MVWLASMKLHEKLRELRKSRGFSQQGLAERIGIHITYLSRLENGHNEPSLEVIRKLMDVCGVSADFLLRDDEDNFEVQIKDKDLAERIRLIDSLDDKSRQALMEVIDQMLTNQKMKQLLNSADLANQKAS